MFSRRLPFPLVDKTETRLPLAPTSLQEILKKIFNLVRLQICKSNFIEKLRPEKHRLHLKKFVNLKITNKFNKSTIFVHACNLEMKYWSKGNKIICNGEANFYYLTPLEMRQ